MGDADTSSRRGVRGSIDLDEQAREAREGRARREALLKAEQAARSSGSTEVQWPAPPADSAERYAADVARLDGELGAIPSVGAVLRGDLRQQEESIALTHALERAERVERVAEGDEPPADDAAGEDETPAEDALSK